MVTPTLAGLGIAVPPTLAQRDLWDGFFATHYAQVRSAERIFANAGVTYRHAAISPLREDISTASTGARMERYLAEALPLARNAVVSALADADLAPADIGLFAVASCTGYGTPGVDIRLAAELGFAPDAQRLVIGHMGCYAAFPGLAAVTDYVTAHQRPAVLLCIELTSLHVQPPTRNISQVVAHALFSDAAAAVVVTPGTTGYRVLDIVSATDPTTAGQMTWDITDHGFRMGLSPRVPDSLAVALPGLVDRLLARHGLTPADIDRWAVHPGGPRILDVVAESLDLPPAAMEPSRATLRRHGNCSSATILLILDDLTRTPSHPGTHLAAMAFGPGLTLYTALLEAVA
jgi:predicted naringenin-chalcone synthase